MIVLLFLFLDRNWNKQPLNKRSLLSVIFATFWKEYVILTICCFSNDIVLRLGQPFLLGLLLQYFQKDTNIAYHDAILYAVGLVALNGLNALFLNHVLLLSFHNSMKVRVAVCSLVYRKVCFLIILKVKLRTKVFLKFQGIAAFSDSSWWNITRKSGEFTVERCESLWLGFIFYEFIVVITVTHFYRWWSAMAWSWLCWIGRHSIHFFNRSSFEYVNLYLSKKLCPQ